MLSSDPTVPAFVQARNKIKIEAFEQLFYQTIPSGTQDKGYKGYQLLAHDGSDINIPYNEKDPDIHRIADKGYESFNVFEHIKKVDKSS